jgi:sulfatase maturation enzyme AslB (radical SAM superfamily)
VTITDLPTRTSVANVRVPATLSLELTGKCQLDCLHCYADSGPKGTHGVMAAADWIRVMTHAAALGVRRVQFIGGEPLLYPHVKELLETAFHLGLAVEVFSNLVRVPQDLWPLLERPGVVLATSWYSDDPAEHFEITRRNTYAQTLANITRARARGITVRASLTRVLEHQRIAEARGQLAALGVSDLRVDHVRAIGRARPADVEPTADALCGRCTTRLAVKPSGVVTPCVMSGWLPVGNVLTDGLAAILAGPVMSSTRDELESAFAARAAISASPDDDDDDLPDPDPLGDVCSPELDGNCGP